jgi:uncharacterized protein (DUF4415 family)
MRKIIRRVIKPPQLLTPQDPDPFAGLDTPRAARKPPDWTDGDLPLPRGKRLISLRLDADIVEHFQAGGKGYQTRMNAVLRAWVEARKRRHI